MSINPTTGFVVVCLSHMDIRLKNMAIFLKFFMFLGLSRNPNLTVMPIYDV